MGIWVRVILLSRVTGRVEDSLVSHVKAQGPKLQFTAGLTGARSRMRCMKLWDDGELGRPALEGEVDNWL